MIEWKIKNNTISELYIGGENIIYPWGIETADSWSFYSMEENSGYRFKKIINESKLIDNQFSTSQIVKMKEGKWHLNTIDEIGASFVQRFASLECLEKSVFMDFVVRFRFKKENFQLGIIDKNEILHKSSNIYYQYPVNEAFLFGEKYKIKIKIEDFEGCNKFNPNIYIRDHANEWVVHVRMIPSEHKNMVIKLCSKYFKTSPLPLFLSCLILKSNYIKNYLTYRSEFKPYKSRIGKFFSLNAFPMVQLSVGDILKWKVKMEIEEN